jgi:hypothetical protein
MPILDLFSIAKGLKAGQDAYSRGQKEQADQYWSDIENSLKTMASAQGIRQSAELYPLQLRQEQAKAQYAPQKLAQELKTEEAQTFSTEQMGKVHEIKAKTDQQILDALQGAYAKFQIANPENKQSYNEWFYENYSDLGPKLQKALEAVKTQQQSTRHETALATGAEQKVTAGTEEQKAYTGAGTTKGAVIVGTEIAQMEKAKSDAVVSAAKEKYADKQAKATLDATQARAEKSAETGGYKTSQWADDVGIIDRQIDTLNNRNALINKSLAYLSKSSSIDEFIQAIAAQNNTDLTNVAGQVVDAASLESAKNALLDDKRANTERISFWIGRKNQLNKLAGMPEEPTIQVKQTDQTIQLSMSEFTGSDSQTRSQIIRNQVNKGIRRIELLGLDGKVNTTIDITLSPRGDFWSCKYTRPDGTVNTFGVSKTPQTKPTTQPTAKPAQQPATTQAPAQQITEQQNQYVTQLNSVIKNLLSRGVNSERDLTPSQIATLQHLGIYKQVIGYLRNWEKSHGTTRQ